MQLHTKPFFPLCLQWNTTWLSAVKPLMLTNSWYLKWWIRHKVIGSPRAAGITRSRSSSGPSLHAWSQTLKQPWVRLLVREMVTQGFGGFFGSGLKFYSRFSVFWYLQMINLLFWSWCTTTIGLYLFWCAGRVIQKLYWKSTFSSTRQDLDCSHVKKTVTPSLLYEINYWSTARRRFQMKISSVKVKEEKRLKVGIKNRIFMRTNKIIKRVYPKRVVDHIGLFKSQL